MLDGLYEGLAWVVSFFYDLTHSYGVAIILLTILVMAVVTPLTLKGTKSMMAMQRFQPEIKRLQQEHKGDRQKLNEELLKFYRENNINPMGSCLPMLIQMPIFFVLFHVVRGLTRVGPDGTFNPQYLDESTALWRSLSQEREMLFLRFDLARSPYDVLTNRSILAAIPFLLLVGLWVGTSYYQQRQIAGRNPEAMTPQQRMLMRVVPIFSLTAMFFPAALSLYWVTSNVCRVATQGYISRKFYGIRRGKLPDGTIEANSTPKSPNDVSKDASSKPDTFKPGTSKPDTSKSETKSKNASAAKASSKTEKKPSGAGKSGAAPGRARQSGRVTQPKRRTPAAPTTRAPARAPGGRPAPGRRGPEAPRSGGSRNRPKRRSAPAPAQPEANGQTDSSLSNGAVGNDGTDGPRKKRRR